MLKVFDLLKEPVETELELLLPFELRQKSRLKACLTNGTEVGLMLPRGVLLRGGDCVMAEDGSVIRVLAANEEVSTARHESPLMISRAAYHLGNRHVPVQIGEFWLRYQHDHVLDDMVRGLGLTVKTESVPFEPESGAYGGHAHHHHHHEDDGS